MPKNQTSWSNNDVKPSTGWTGVAKNTDVWVNNDVKPVTPWTTKTKNTDVWSVNYGAKQTYLYNDAYMTYNSSLTFYDYLVNTNTLNQKLQTRWSTT